jgi:hypothetical protein
MAETHCATTGTDFNPNTFVAQVLYTQANSSSPTAMPAKLDGVEEIFIEEQDIARSAMVFAYFVGIQTHKPYTTLLDELDKRMTLRRTTRGVQPNVHWSNGGPAYYISKAKDKFPSFLYFTAQFSLFKHVSEKVKNKKQDKRILLERNCVKASQLQRGPYFTSLCPLSLERSRCIVDRGTTGIVL